MRYLVSHFHPDLEGAPRKATWFPVHRTGLRYFACPSSDEATDLQTFLICLGEPIVSELVRKKIALGKRLGRLALLRLIQPFCPFELNIDKIESVNKKKLEVGFHGYAGYEIRVTQSR